MDALDFPEVEPSRHRSSSMEVSNPQSCLLLHTWRFSSLAFPRATNALP